MALLAPPRPLGTPIKTIGFDVGLPPSLVFTELTGGFSDTDAQSYVTASVTMVPGRLYFLCVTNTHATATVAPTVGTGVAGWAQVATSPAASNIIRHTIFRHVVPMSITGTITISIGGTLNTGCSWTLIEVQNAKCTGDNGADGVVQSVAHTTASGLTDTVALAAFADATNNGTLVGFGEGVSANTITGDTGMTLSTIRNPTAPVGRHGAQWRVGADTSVVTTVATTAARWVSVGVEIAYATEGQPPASDWAYVGGGNNNAPAGNLPSTVDTSHRLHIKATAAGVTSWVWSNPYYYKNLGLVACFEQDGGTGTPSDWYMKLILRGQVPTTTIGAGGFGWPSNCYGLQYNYQLGTIDLYDTNGFVSFFLTQPCTAGVRGANVKVWMRMECFGDVIRGKVWAETQAEPGSWDFSVRGTAYSAGLFYGVMMDANNVVGNGYCHQVHVYDPEGPQANELDDAEMILLRGASALTATLGLASESDSAFALGRKKLRTTGLAAEADSAFAIRPGHVRTLGLTTEADSGFVIRPGHARTLGLPSEADSAFVIGQQKTKALGLVTEADSAFVVRPGHARTLGLPTEADVGFALSSRKYKTLGLASEADSVFVIRASHARTLGLVSEADSAFALRAVHLRTLGLALEADSAFAARAAHARTLGLVTEADSAFALRAAHLHTLGLASETDSGFALRAAHAHTLGLASESDSAFVITGHLSSSGGGTIIVVLGVAIETDSGFSVRPAHVRTLGLVTEADSAFPVRPSHLRTLGLVSELDSAFALRAAHLRTLGLVTEADSAFAVRAAHARTLGLATELDSAFALARKKSLLLGLASESNIGLALRAAHVRTLGFATETDVAFALGRRHLRTLGLATELDTALHVVVTGLLVIPDDVMDLLEWAVATRRIEVTNYTQWATWLVGPGAVAYRKALIDLRPESLVKIGGTPERAQDRQGLASDLPRTRRLGGA